MGCREPPPQRTPQTGHQRLTEFKSAHRLRLLVHLPELAWCRRKPLEWRASLPSVNDQAETELRPNLARQVVALLRGRTEVVLQTLSYPPSSVLVDDVPNGVTAHGFPPRRTRGQLALPAGHRA